MVENSLDEVSIIKQKAEFGDSLAQLQWALICLCGKSQKEAKPLKKRVAEAIIWLEKSCKQRCTQAQFILGCVYDVYTENKEEAFRWWKKAAEQEDARAIVRIAECLLNGNGVEKDIDEAIKWYKTICPFIEVESFLEKYKMQNQQ